MKSSSIYNLIILNTVRTSPTNFGERQPNSGQHCVTTAFNKGGESFSTRGVSDSAIYDSRLSEMQLRLQLRPLACMLVATVQLFPALVHYYDCSIPIRSLTNCPRNCHHMKEATAVGGFEPEKYLQSNVHALLVFKCLKERFNTFDRRWQLGFLLVIPQIQIKKKYMKNNHR